MKLNTIFIIVSCFMIGCSNAQIGMKTKNVDTLHRPLFMGKAARLLNFGSEDEPIMVWAEYIGFLQKGNVKYSHIVGVQFYYVKAAHLDTLYYENLELRNRQREINLNEYTLVNYPGEATIKVFNAVDSLLFFNVLESSEFAREHRGINFKRMPTISFNSGNYTADWDLEFNLKESNDMFELTLNDGTKLKYKICKKCEIKDRNISFLNREDGTIYFINKDCFLELVDKKDVEKLKDAR